MIAPKEGTGFMKHTDERAEKNDSHFIIIF